MVSYLKIYTKTPLLLCCVLQLVYAISEVRWISVYVMLASSQLCFLEYSFRY